MVSGLLLEAVQHVFHIDVLPPLLFLSLFLDSTFDVRKPRGDTDKGAYAQLPIILRRHVLVLLDPPRPREILHPKFLSLIYVHRPRLCYLEDSQHLGRDRSARWGIIPETRNDACVVVVFNEDPAQLRGARTACTMVSIHTTTTRCTTRHERAVSFNVHGRCPAHLPAI